MPLRLCLFWCLAALGAACASAQSVVPVPSPSARAPVAAEFWLRTWVKVDDSFFTKH